MAQQPHTESRIARRLRLARPRRQSAHQPARPGGAGSRLGRDPQQQRHDPGGFRRQSEPAARGQVELARLAPGLDQRRAERRTARRFRPGPEHALAVARPHQQQLRRIEAELGQARRMQAAGLGVEEVLPGPEQRAPARRPQRQRRGKAGGGGKIGRCRGIDLMQGGAGDAAAERLVQARRSEADELRRRERARQPRQSEALPQGGQGTGGGIGHSVSMFTLCSSIERLQNAPESSPRHILVMSGPQAPDMS